MSEMYSHFTMFVRNSTPLEVRQVGTSADRRGLVLSIGEDQVSLHIDVDGSRHLIAELSSAMFRYGVPQLATDTDHQQVVADIRNIMRSGAAPMVSATGGNPLVK